MPKIVVFWGKPAGPIEGKYAYPYKNIGPKAPVYEQLFYELAKKAEVYAAIGYDNYPAPLTFGEAFHFEDGKFVRVENIKADAIYDRSAKMTFPEATEAENQKVVNSSKFKLFSNNKWALYQRFGKYCPKTYFVENQKDLAKILAELPKDKMYVLKPFNGYKGKGILFGKPHDFDGYTLEGSIIIQEFMETAAGIPGITTGRHDLRITVIDGKIVWATVRQPKDDETLLANVAQGGSITEIPLQKIPESVVPIVKEMAEVFKNEFYNPLFSVDFGFSDNKPFIYEINDQIGFPQPNMHENIFVTSLADLLLKKASL
jgi:glutathione synthase/RimK-type ligase-like ATP-grasp enzyme